ncbi:hypothetical protein JVU11DRAFT_7475 [Chiua virens]|nr:hypothetical protein JVU11DRAFT_7475 [Chiua virens]
MAQSDNNQSQAYPQDPILQYRPPFVQSLPVQIFLIGIVLTLAGVLLLHLLFTAQYHWPLARTNYVLQITGVITLLISSIATIYVIFSTAVEQSQHWPYMLSYLAVEMPAAEYTNSSNDPTLAYLHSWTSAESATWVVMNATTSVVVQITHIHFLTLLFPSDLEARLIFTLIGPLAIISAVMQLLPVICGPSVVAISEDTRNVCNATLSLLFTLSLVIWGFFVNRRQAWRTDGGTAAFGIGAIILAVVSSSLNLLYIPRQDQYAWMPKLMWAVTLWQSFLGWWWWVGAGMGVREVEELLQRENKRQQKRILRAQRRKEHREKAKSVWKGVTAGVSTQLEPQARLPFALARCVGRVKRVWCHIPVDAARPARPAVAVERTERLHQVYQREEERNVDWEHRKRVLGWGLGSYGMREAERERREEMLEMEMMTSDRTPVGEDDEEWKDVDDQPDASGRETEVHSGEARLRRRAVDPTSPPAQQTDEPVAGSSLWWWGPLRRWRLQDSTTYR